MVYKRSQPQENASPAAQLVEKVRQTPAVSSKLNKRWTNLADLSTF